jgi:Ca2+-dependent lipid-binding protein
MTTDKYIIYVQPCIDFGLNLLGGDIMAIPGLYQYVQVLSLSIWFGIGH